MTALLAVSTIALLAGGGHDHDADGCPVGSAAPAATSTAGGLAPVCETPACLELADSMFKTMNLTADPCEDFFEYACGGFVVNNPIPDDKSSMSQFSILQDKTQTTLRRLLENSDATGGMTQSVADFYHSCMDLDAIETVGLAPAQALVDAIPEQRFPRALDFNALATDLGMIHSSYGSPFFAFYVGADSRDSTSNAVSLYQVRLC